MNPCQKLGIALLSFTAITQVLPANSATFTTPYPVNLGVNTNANTNTKILPDWVTLLNDCDPKASQPGTGTPDPSNPGHSTDPNNPSQEVPEPTAIAGMALAAGVGAWWKKKAARKVAQEG